jgi:hypothetical protein
MHLHFDRRQGRVVHLPMPYFKPNGSFYIPLSNRFHQQGPYSADSTASRPLCEVKQRLARLVLRWGTTLESQVFLFCFLNFFIIALLHWNNFIALHLVKHTCRLMALSVLVVPPCPCSIGGTSHCYQRPLPPLLYIFQFNFNN